MDSWGRGWWFILIMDIKTAIFSLIALNLYSSFDLQDIDATTFPPLSPKPSLYENQLSSTKPSHPSIKRPLLQLQYILNIRMSNAQALLESTNYTINEISNIVGYDNQLYFSRLFRKQKGMSPKQYRGIFFGAKNAEKSLI